MSIRRALGVSAVAQTLSFVFNFINVIVVSRLLTPGEIGIYSVAVSALGIAHVFREFGVTQYLVQATAIGKNDFRAAFTLTLLFSWTIAVVLFFAREPLSIFYEHPGISAVLGLLAINFLLLPFGTPSLAMLRRELRFETLAAVRIANSGISTAVTIACALAGESYLSMAWGAIAGQTSNIVILAVIRRGETFILPTVKGLRGILRFGSVSSLTSLINQLGASAPDLILGRTLGFAPVAYFSRAAGLRSMFLGQLYTLVNGVHFPTFAAQIRAGENAKDLYIRNTMFLVAITVPAMSLLAVLADPLIRFFFGPQWESAAPLATLLCLFSLITAPYALANLSLVAAGKVSHVLRIEIIVQSSTIALLLSSIWLPLDKVVPLLVFASIIEAISYQLALKRTFGLGVFTLLRELRSGFFLIPFTVTGPLVATQLIPRDDTSLGLFVLLSASGVLAFFGWIIGIVLLKHPAWSEISSLASRFKAKA
ncbi:MAG: oligosaccharide flippase family protein [Azoarcus sp.]|nr:oligosaccharide flippase family protein [Azoarcus sp.]